MASQPRVLRSTCSKAGPRKVNRAPAPGTSQAQAPQQGTANVDNAVMNAVRSTKPVPKKQKQPTTTPELQSSERVIIPEKEHASWYLCPVDDCDAGYAQARPTGPLADHYKQKHPELHMQEPWESSRAQKVNFVKWLNGQTKGMVPARMKKKYQRLIRGSEDEGICQEHRARAGAAAAAVDIATAAVFEEGPPSPPAAKRRKLDDLLDKQERELQDFIEQEMREAKGRADKAEAKLQRLGAERSAEMVRDEARMRRMSRRIAELEEEIEDEKNFGSSSRLKQDYLHQARVEAKLCLCRPKHGGFVY